MYLTQQNKILQLLQESPNGVNSYDLTYTHYIKQAPTRIKELKEKGYLITSTHNKNQSVTYHLVGEINKQTPQVTTQPHSEDGCQDESHYRAYVKNDRKFFEHVREPEQMTI
jgi:hypothetical protein